MKVKTIFELDQKEPNVENVIIAVPVGDKDDDEVMPGIQNGEKWLDTLHILMVAKGEEECLQKYWNLKKILPVLIIW